LVLVLVGIDQLSIKRKRLREWFGPMITKAKGKAKAKRP
jgi:hypothetical protein